MHTNNILCDYPEVAGYREYLLDQHWPHMANFKRFLESSTLEFGLAGLNRYYKHMGIDTKGPVMGARCLRNFSVSYTTINPMVDHHSV